jgi:hypothetical protein
LFERKELEWKEWREPPEAIMITIDMDGVGDASLADLNEMYEPIGHDRACGAKEQQRAT